MHGFLVVDKPLGITSRDAVDRVQEVLPKDVRVGHTGTLDPLATGVLVLALGQATRLTEYVQQQTKEYRAGVRFGTTSSTDDAEGPLSAVNNAALPTRAQLELALAGFVGMIEQTPPTFSAAHVNGVRAYRMARKGKAVDLKPKAVHIENIDVLDYCPPNAELAVRCGKGTYIRSIARDLGRVVGCGAYLSSLRRTRVGPFRDSHALPIDASAAEFAAGLRPLRDALTDLPQLTLQGDEIRRLSMGQAVPTAAQFQRGVAVLDDVGALRVLAVIENGNLRPNKVFSCSDAST